MERNKEKENSLSYGSDSENKRNSVKESDENKENMIMNSELKEESVFYQDEEVLNDSVISGKQSHCIAKIHSHNQGNALKAAENTGKGKFLYCHISCLEEPW